MRSAVRPIVTIAMTSAVITGFAVGLIDPQAFMSLAVSVITFWFVKRDEEKKREK